MLCTALILALSTSPALTDIGPCHGELCPNADIVVSHNKTSGGSSATLTDHNSNPPRFRFVGLGSGSTKKLKIDSVEFYPCGELTWSDVTSCADICYTCLN